MATGRPLDAVINGEGFFAVQVEPSVSSSGVAYTRAGNFALNSDGELVLANDQGRRVQPTVQIPANAINPSISSDGRITYSLPGEAETQEVGPIQLTTFVNPAGLRQVGENLYTDTDASGPPTSGIPGEENRGRLQGSFLENSNVDPTRELIELIRTQRAFEMNSQSIRSADEALRSVAQLRR
jgi:flagellar basal-body rod protein FlgG